MLPLTTEPLKKMEFKTVPSDELSDPLSRPDKLDDSDSGEELVASDAADVPDVADDNVDCTVPVGVWAACAVAAVWLATPSAFVVDCGR
jgi:hypothetical protein